MLYNYSIGNTNIILEILNYFKQFKCLKAQYLLIFFRSVAHPDPTSLTQNMERLSQILRGVVARPGVTV